MGVRGLTGFVERASVLQPIHISPSNPQKFVLDGASLTYFIYENGLDWRVGQYKKFSEDLVDFVRKLQTSGGIIETVVFDSGRGNPRKRQTRLKRDTNSMRLLLKQWEHSKLDPYLNLNQDHPSTLVLPALTHYIAMHTLRQLGISVTIAKEEADKVLAAYAQETSSIVLGNDSDFFIFQLNEGYIPFRSITFVDSSFYALHFKQERLAKYLGLKKELFPLMACAFGCDFVDPEKIRESLYYRYYDKKKPFHEQTLKILTSLNAQPSLHGAIMAFFKCFETSNKDGQRKELESCFMEALQEYQIDTSLVHTPMDPHDPHGHLTDPLCFQVFFCFPLLDDYEMSNAWDASRPLRLQAYRKWAQERTIVEYVWNSEKPDVLTIESFPMDQDAFVHLERDPSLMHRCVRYLLEQGFLSLRELLAIAITIRAPPTVPARVWAPVHSARVMGLLETTLVSGSMLWSMPIDVHDIVDPPSLFTSLERLCSHQGSVKAALHALMEAKSVGPTIQYLNDVLRNHPKDFFEKNSEWVYDLKA